MIGKTPGTPSTRRVLAAVVALIAVASAGCRTGSNPVTAGPGGRAEPAAVIVISDTPAEFMPNALTIRVGDTVEWRNTGGSSHSVEFVGETLPQGTASSESGLMLPHETYSYTFKAPGSYAYICRFHVINGMVGKVVVVADHPASGATAGTH